VVRVAQVGNLCVNCSKSLLKLNSAVARLLLILMRPNKVFIEREAYTNIYKVLLSYTLIFFSKTSICKNRIKNTLRFYMTIKID